MAEYKSPYGKGGYFNALTTIPETYDYGNTVPQTNMLRTDFGNEFNLPDYGAPMESAGLFDSWSGKDMLGGAMGIGQFGLGLMNYFNNRDMIKNQRRATDQQIAESKYSIQHHKDFSDGVRKAFS